MFINDFKKKKLLILAALAFFFFLVVLHNSYLSTWDIFP